MLQMDLLWVESIGAKKRMSGAQLVRSVAKINGWPLGAATPTATASDSLTGTMLHDAVVVCCASLDDVRGENIEIWVFKFEFIDSGWLDI